MKNIYVMRHAESLEDIDKTAYERIPDENMPITDFGKRQVTQFCKEFIGHIAGIKNLCIYISPCLRVLETAQIIVSNLPRHIRWHLCSDNLIAKQNWGNITLDNRQKIEKERYSAGVLRYKFQGGESGAELLSRFGLFAKKLEEQLQNSQYEHILVITHGFELRVLLKSLLGWTEDYFETLAHPHHCEMKRISYCDGAFINLDAMRIHDLADDPSFVKRKII